MIMNEFSLIYRLYYGFFLRANNISTFLETSNLFKIQARIYAAPSSVE